MNTNVFIAALPRSGSTLLGALLQQSAMIYHAGESFYWGRLDPSQKSCSCGKIGCEFLLQILASIDQSPHKNDILSICYTCGLIDRFEEPLKEAHKISLSYGVEKVTMADLDCTIPKCIFGFKHLAEICRDISCCPVVIDNSKYIRLAGELLEEDWKIIILVRDPRGLAYSNKKLCERKHVNRPLEQKIEVYTNFALRALELQRSSHVTLIRYEDLCSNLKDSLYAICAFLKIPYENTMRSINDRGHALMGNRFMFTYGSDYEVTEDLEWRIGLDKKELSLIYNNKDLVAIYKQLGYYF